MNRKRLVTKLRSLGPLLALVSVSAFAVTADDVVCDRCVAASDIAANEVSSSKLRPNLRLRGDTTNPLSGNGIVKAWARINANGTVESCYRCDPFDTQRLNEGDYEVSFRPLATDIRGRPRLATIDTFGGISLVGEISLADRVGQADEVFVQTANSSGIDADRPFVLVIF
ncbi:MAG: hypothetical protein ACREWG_11195 [Gammaproteobacteria bacterium]